MKIISVIPLKKGILKGNLTYFSNLNISPGNIVSAPIKNKNILALVTSVEELKEAKSSVKNMNFDLKKIVENKGNSIFLKEFLDTVFTTNKYFVQNENNTLVSLIPNFLLKEYEKIIKINDNKNNPHQGETDKKNNSEDKRNLKSEKLLFQYRTEDRISIYKTLIRESFARNKSIFIILPTQFDIEKFTNYLSRGIEQFTFNLHGNLSTTKKLMLTEKIITSSHPVLVLCTPPFLAIPRRDIATIILEHENSNAYRVIGRPHLDLRTFTEIYASKINAKFIMADKILRYETIGRKDAENLNLLHPLSFRTDFTGEIEISGKERGGNKKFQIFNSEILREIKFAIENKKNVFVFSLRKGLATMTTCKDCGETLSCKKCEAPLVLYLSKEKKRMFVCHRCEKEIDSNVICPSCQSWNLVPLGIGTDTVYEELKKLFPGTNIFKLDKESVKNGTAAKKIINDFEKTIGGILIGTEMSFFYLKNKIPLSIIASFDSLWSIPNYKMGEKIIQIIFSIIENTKEKLIIQTKNKEDSAILAIKSSNLSSFVREELENRKELSYPPFKRFIKITCLGNKKQTIESRVMLKEVFKEYLPEIFSGFVARLKNQYVTNALIKIEPHKWSLPELKTNSSIDENLFRKLSSLPPAFQIFVDPEDLL